MERMGMYRKNKWQDEQGRVYVIYPVKKIMEDMNRSISFEAKAIYGMMINRVNLSIKNGWLDEVGKTYIHYSVADIMADAGCGKNKILKCLKELEEDVSLIECKKQRQGRPDMIYVKNFAIEEVEETAENVSEVCNVNLKEFTMQTSRSPECKP